MEGIGAKDRPNGPDGPGGQFEGAGVDDGEDVGVGVGVRVGVRG